MEDVAIYGAGGLGSQVQDILEQGTQYRPVVYLDSDTEKHGTDFGGLPVVGGMPAVAHLLRSGVRGVIVAIGDNVARAAHGETLRAHGLRLISAIHPLASISPSAQVGAHVVIAARVTLCVHARVGAHSVLCASAIAEHDNVIGSAVFLGPAVRLAGAVVVEDFATLEIGATVIPGRRVGAGAYVKAGAVVIRDVPPAATFAGVPALAQAGFQSRFVPDAPTP